MTTDNGTKQAKGKTASDAPEEKPEEKPETREERLLGEIALRDQKMMDALAAIRADKIDHAIVILSP